MVAFYGMVPFAGSHTNLVVSSAWATPSKHSVKALCGDHAHASQTVHLILAKRARRNRGFV